MVFKLIDSLKTPNNNSNKNFNYYPIKCHNFIPGKYANILNTIGTM